jgi:hypothetical protein
MEIFHRETIDKKEQPLYSTLWSYAQYIEKIIRELMVAGIGLADMI